MTLSDAQICWHKKRNPVGNERGRVIGVAGGMGPQAGVALMNSILAHTNAATDQDHLPAILMSFPGEVVDRTAFLEGQTSINPAYSIARIIGRLEMAGASVIGIACNTSHAPAIYNTVLDELQQNNSGATILHMPYEVCAYIRQQYPRALRVGIMVTNGTYRCGIYQGLLQGMGYEVIQPDRVFQQEVIHRMIYDPHFGIKANTKAITPQVNEWMQEALDHFNDRQADVVIMGCTELSLVPLEHKSSNLLIADALDILAKALIREAAGLRKGHSGSAINELLKIPSKI